MITLTLLLLGVTSPDPAPLRTAVEACDRGAMTTLIKAEPRRRAEWAEAVYREQRAIAADRAGLAPATASPAGQATLALSGRVGGDVKAGETVTLTVNGKAVQVTIEDSPSGLVFHTDVATADLLANPHFSVEVSGQDLAGNTAHATAQHSVGVDLHAEATVTINTLAGDNVLNAAEAQKPTTTVSDELSTASEVRCSARAIARRRDSSTRSSSR